MTDLSQAVSDIVELLVKGKFQQLETMTNGVRLSATDISTAVFEYDRKLVTPPAKGFELLDVVEVRDSNPRRWSVVMPLWTEEEGRSDLSIELTLIEKDNGFDIELDDIHVL